MNNALIEAVDLQMDCVQVFTKNQRQWNAKPLQEHEIESWLSELDNQSFQKLIALQKEAILEE